MKTLAPPVMKLIANYDGQVIISSTKRGVELWYTFQLASNNHLYEDLKRIIINIQNGRVKPVSYNGQYSNYMVDNIYISVAPPFTKSDKVACEYQMISETPEMYHKYIKPHVQCPKWILNIEQGTAKGEVIIKQTSDYILLPDFKWDRKSQNLYLLLIFKDSTLGSIRDLTDKHIPLLERAQAQVLKYIADEYKLPASKIRFYFHYMPSAWRLHMHVQHVSANTSLGSGTQCGRARTLGEVLNNIKLMPDYYQKATLECVLNQERYNVYYGI